MSTLLLSGVAQSIAAATLEALQEADEIGGCPDCADYIALMDHLLAEINHRRDAAIEQLEANHGFYADTPLAHVLASRTADVPSYNW